jgi:hypothetical protein
LTSKTSAAAAHERQATHEQIKKEQACEKCFREERSAAQGLSAECMERKDVGLEALMATRVQVLHLFVRVERLSGQVDEAFGGQAFMRNAGGPASPANRRRFNAYADCLKKLSGLLWDAIVLWALTSGVKLEDDWTPMVLLHGPPSGQGASKCESGCREGLAVRFFGLRSP